MLSVGDLMHTHVCRVEPSQKVVDVARILILHDADCALITHDGVLLGIATERDLLRSVLPTEAEINERDSLRVFADLVEVARDHFPSPVESVMTSPVRTLSPDTSLIRALSAMLSGGIHRLPVVDSNGAVVGLVTQRDLLRAVFMEFQGAAGVS
ncbi:MAG: CBS domain-containing protein [Acidimicrobiales bacterium]|jgi:CBS domain-containing membrane protein